jgi:cytochrome P450
MTEERVPVSDWETDFDHTDPRWAEDPYPIFDRLRDNCPVAHTDRFLGVYLPTTYQAVAEIAKDPASFSSRRIVVRDTRPEFFFSAPPITSDPPEHQAAKRMLLPPFTPDAAKALEPQIRTVCNALIDQFIAEGKCDAATQYARPVSVLTMIHMLGVSEQDSDLFVKWIHETLELGVKNDAILMKAFQEMAVHFGGYIARRKQQPGSDLISLLLAARDHNGEPLTDVAIHGTLRLLMMAGIDTSWSAIGASLWHLAKTPSDRARLIAEPELMPFAIEEFLRAYSPVTAGREVMKETTVDGRPMKPGNMVLLCFPAANRDPAVFPDADKVIIDRQQNRHVAFGLGIHRCVGAHLGRLEMRVAIEEWLKRIPDFRLDPGGEVKWAGGQVRGPRQLPLLFGTAQA